MKIPKRKGYREDGKFKYLTLDCNTKDCPKWYREASDETGFCGRGPHFLYLQNPYIQSLMHCRFKDIEVDEPSVDYLDEILMQV